MHVMGEGLIQSIIRYFDIEDTYNGALSKLSTKPLYDFYLPRDISGDGYTVRSYSGLEYNEEIVSYLRTNYQSNSDAKLDKILLTEKPESAIAYCFNKNKRNSSGVVETQKWFLPSIDEIEDIAVGAYDEFNKVFQSNKYWSCQPSYERRLLHLDLKYLGYFDVGDLEADYYIDDINRARATAATFVGIDANGEQKYEPLSSGTPGSTGTQTGQCNATATMGTSIVLDANCKFTPFTDEQFINSGNEGNLSRTESCRIRAVYRSGTK